MGPDMATTSSVVQIKGSAATSRPFPPIETCPRPVEGRERHERAEEKREGLKTHFPAPPIPSPHQRPSPPQTQHRRSPHLEKRLRRCRGGCRSRLWTRVEEEAEREETAAGGRRGKRPSRGIGEEGREEERERGKGEEAGGRREGEGVSAERWKKEGNSLPAFPLIILMCTADMISTRRVSATTRCRQIGLGRSSSARAERPSASTLGALETKETEDIPAAAPLRYSVAPTPTGSNTTRPFPFPSLLLSAAARPAIF